MPDLAIDFPAGELRHYCVAVLLMDQRRRILLHNNEHYPSQVGSVGGHLRRFEPQHDAAHRLVRSVAGVVPSDLLFVKEFEAGWESCEYDVRRHKVHLFTARFSGELQQANRNGDGFRAYAKEDLASLRKPIGKVWLWCLTYGKFLDCS